MEEKVGQEVKPDSDQNLFIDPEDDDDDEVRLCLRLVLKPRLS